MVPSFRFNLFSLFLLPFGIKTLGPMQQSYLAHSFFILLLFEFASSTVEQMFYRKDRMFFHHSRARIGHHRADPVAHLGLVAVNLTFGAWPLVRTERTFVKTLIGIIQKRPTIRT